jgi:hypothetical protein
MDNKCPTCNHEVSKFGCTPGINMSPAIGEFLDCACPPGLRLRTVGDELADLVEAFRDTREKHL